MIKDILAYAAKNKCSDVLISTGSCPFVKMTGELLKIPKSTELSAQQVTDMLFSIMSQEQMNKYNNILEIDFAYNLDDTARFRVNAFNTLNGPAIAFRVIGSQVRKLEEISNCPQVIYELLEKKSGLVIVSGPTGSGKSTTLAAMINHINENHNYNIITIEDPIEYIHINKKSLVLQKEVGSHTKSFSNGLKSSLREIPNVIMVGEIRDKETCALAITAAETGHLVFATLHSRTAPQAISRIIDMFDAQEKNIIRSMLADSINAVILQQLVKNNQNQLSSVFEIMVGNQSIKNLIREDKISQIPSMMEIGQKFGMRTFKDAIKNLVAINQISQSTADQYLSVNN